MKKLANRKQKFRQQVAIVLTLIMLTEIVMPTVTFALTSGPGAPEFSSFEPVTTTTMVNEFSGDFTYNIPVINIPGANGGGYALSLSYHSGETSESEASWVGYGWTLNPGAINRGKKGFADDTKNTHTFFNDVPKNWTVSVGGRIGNPEILTVETDELGKITSATTDETPISMNASLRYNNYRGFGYTAGIGGHTQNGLVSLGYSVSDGSGAFSASINPAALLNDAKAAKKKKEEQFKDYYNDLKTCDENAATFKKDLHDQKAKGNRNNVSGGGLSNLSATSSAYGMYAISDQQMPSAVTPYSGYSANLDFNVQVDPTPLEAGFQFGFVGNYNEQSNLKSANRTGYGYLYSNDAYADGGGMMDYSVEKESMYNKRDRYLSIPFGAADNFAVTGEGLGGGFKFHSRTAGRFRPNTAKSKTDLVQLAASVHMGLFYGPGFTGGYGQQTLSVDGEKWETPYGSAYGTELPAIDNGDEPYFPRFNGDLGGDVDYGTSENNQQNNGVITASLEKGNVIPGIKSYYPELVPSQYGLASSIPTENGSVKRSGRSSYISYHTNAELNSVDRKAKSYQKADNMLTNGTLTRNTNPKHIGEIATVNEEGNTYVYGLPVYVKNETNLSYDLRGATASQIKNNFLAYKDLSQYKMKVGSVDNGGYASSYLLTQITTPDYVDRLMDGPTTDDFGGYTKFEYEKIYSNNEALYHFRIPYTGLNYSKEQLSDCLDDMGSYVSGDKEVYYLKEVKTKTYTAKFITEDREDGLDAAKDDVAAKTEGAKGNHKLKKLVEIQLWTNSAVPLMVKKIVFKYDYSLSTGVLNNINNGGKLTLKQLWFEYEGVVKAKISPYTFEYAYPKSSSSNVYPAVYAKFQQQYGDANLKENPGYSPFAIDAWGNYQDPTIGALRFSKLKTSVNQSPPRDFDPAAWQLKVIKLPSGGEIHVQYEQDEYLYVQNRRAMSNVSIGKPSIFNTNGDPISDETFTIDNINNIAANLDVTNPSNNDLLDPENPSDFTPFDLISTYVLNVNEIGIDNTSPTTANDDRHKLVDIINRTLSGQKIHFKFLYALIGHNPDITRSNSDYVSGYVEFRKAYVSASGKVMIKIGEPTLSEYALPRSVCLDIVKKQKGGKLDKYGNCDASSKGIEEGTSGETLARNLAGMFGRAFFNKISSCLEMNKSLSYFKIPVLKAKKGGGLRVKRILMYDKNGVDVNNAALYGTEYFYQDENENSSGVATNEPSTLRDENALISFLPKRDDKNWKGKIVSGFDKEQFEGPLGESLLPGPSVGYGRIVAKNIHGGATNTGFVVSTFNTAKMYPFDMVYEGLGGANGIDYTSIEDEKDWLKIPAIFVNYSVTNKWAAQGYRFITNEMHGQPLSVETYAGDYDEQAAKLKTYSKSSSTVYEYFKPGESISVMNPDGSIDNNANPGKEMEIASEMKQVSDVTHDGSLEFDFGMGLAVFIPLPQCSFLPSYSYTESKLRTHTTSKSIHYPAMSKSVTTTQDGIKHTVENIVFSVYTGKPVITQTTDGYDGLELEKSNKTPLQNGVYTSYTIPAYSQYKEMGPKAVNEGFIIDIQKAPWDHITISYENRTNYAVMVFNADPGYSVCDAMAIFNKGDLIKINSGTNSYFHVDETDGNEIVILPSALLNSVAPASIIGKIEIMKSGKTNQLNTPVGNYVTYGETQAKVVTDAATLAERNLFASAINDAIVQLKDAGVPSYKVINSNASLITYGNQCKSAHESFAFVSYNQSGFEPYSLKPIVIGNDEYCYEFFDIDCRFSVNPATGILQYYKLGNPCSLIDVACPKFCPNINIPVRVVSAGATTFDSYWPYEASIYGVSSNNIYETGIKGKWRPKGNYVYRNAIIGGAKGNERNYNDAGTFLMTPFNWKNESLNTSVNDIGWIKTSTVSKYSPHGEAIEEYDALNIYSSAKFGYNNTVPYLVAQNSSYDLVAFESFEYIYSNKFEDAVVAYAPQNVTSPVTITAHSGNGAYQLTGSSFSFKPFVANSSLHKNTDMSIKVWVKDVGAIKALMPLKGSLLASGGTNPQSINLIFSKIAQTGAWSLYEAKPNSSLIDNTTYQTQLLSNTPNVVYVDDIRQQPADAKVNTYVYDPVTLRLITSFDDQHFGLYYQYNAEGKLVRKITETEKGKKTIVETQYNTPSVSR